MIAPRFDEAWWHSQPEVMSPRTPDALFDEPLTPETRLVRFVRLGNPRRR